MTETVNTCPCGKYILTSRYDECPLCSKHGRPPMTSLCDKVARVKELAAKAELSSIESDEWVDFMSSFPQIITQLWDENQKQREVLVMAREAMIAYLTGPTQQSLVMDAWDYARDALIGNPTSSLGRDIFESVIDEVEGNLRNALTAIDNVMKGGGGTLRHKPR